MSYPLSIVDAFTDQPFRGNPAAVCLLDHPADAEWMQLVGREMNLSETAFLCREQDAYRLRWFTPTVEVQLCGHATLASAHILWEQGLTKVNEEIRFQTHSGLLTARKQGDWITMDFPSKPAEAAPAPAGLAQALGVAPVSVGRNQFDFLVEIESAKQLRGLKPDFAALAQLPVRGVIVTSPSDDSRYDFVSRFFAPGAGVAEDPVTGSAHCCLAPFWGARLGKDTMVGYQASPRGGVVRVQCQGKRVLLGGQAVTVVRGTLS